MYDNEIKNILLTFTKTQIWKIEDFLLSEIDEENLQETINFVIYDDPEKKKKFANELYKGNQYQGIFLEGNQYLLSSSQQTVLIVDAISKEYGVCEKDTKIQLNSEDFIKLIVNKKNVINWIKNHIKN